MEKVNLNNGKFIISDNAGPIKPFLENGVSNFFNELSRYINENEDPEILHYANEMTLASLFVCGNLRVDQEMTAVQEYGILCSKNDKQVYGRPDIFIKSGSDAFWIECKYQRNLTELGNDHWDVPAWLLWDQENALSQVQTYYNSEKPNANACYKKHYLVTLCFKLIKEEPGKHNKQVSEKLASKTQDEHSRPWYYQVGFMEPKSDGQSLGIEVYGTCLDTLPNEGNQVN